MVVGLNDVDVVVSVVYSYVGDKGSDVAFVLVAIIVGEDV